MKFKNILSFLFLLTTTSCSFSIIAEPISKNSSNESSTSSVLDSTQNDNNSNTNEETSSESSSKESNTLNNSSSNTSSSSSKTTSSISSNITSSSSSSASSSTTKNFTLKILSINDLHGKIEQTDAKQGISNLNYEINRIRNEAPEDDVVLIANGDMFQGQAISNLNHGLSVVNAMNAMDFDMMGIGNHEFDWGIEEITRFFDGNKENGEANFPLINSNVYYKNTSNLLENTLPYKTISREGVKIGLISAIGVNQYSSILKTRADPYEFKNLTSSLSSTADILRSQENCDIVIANIHDGGAYSNGSVNYQTQNNLDLAALTGTKKIDALINGHTHYGYANTISRNSEVPLPVVQAYSSCSSLGVIELEIENKKVVSSSASLIDMRYKTTYDQEIQNIVDADYELLKDQINEVYGVSGETITETTLLENWASSCMQKALDADIAFSNKGGLRGVSLKANNNITLHDAYEINPFDNEILYTTISGSSINNFINRYGSSNYYTIKEGVTIESSKNYLVAVIDYLGFKNYFPLGTNYINSHIIFRDLMVQDIKKRTELGLKFYPSTSPTSYLEKVI